MQVEKLGIDCTQHGGLQPTRHRNVVRVYSPASFRQLAFQIENMARSAWGRQDTPKGKEKLLRAIFGEKASDVRVVKLSLSSLLSRMTEFSPVKITRFASTVLITEVPGWLLIPHDN